MSAHPSKLFQASEHRLYRFCDFLARETEGPVAAIFLADGSFRLGFGETQEKSGTTFYSLPFDPAAAASKAVRFWQQETDQKFSPRHLLRGKVNGAITLHSEDFSEFSLLWERAGRSEPNGSVAKWNKTEDKAAWEKLCKTAEEEIRAGRLEKLVPARFLHFVEPSTTPAWQNYFSLLLEKSGKNTHRFLWRINEQIFFGASPELLVQALSGELLVPAIAGTRAHQGEPSNAIKELESSEKEAREHAIVVRSILECLRQLKLDAAAESSPQILQLPNLVHLYTKVVAKIGKEFSLLSAVRALHPTPAMGGYPREAARAVLKKAESWDRGLYAAPLGFVDEDGSGAFVVGIRSALFAKDAVTVFAGAGYVNGSSAEAEWLETNAKMRGILGVLGL